MGSCGPIFLQMQPNLITHMKLVWHSMLVMLLLVLGIGFLQNVMELLADVISIQQIRWPYQPYFEHEYGPLVWMNVHDYINWGQWLKLHAHLKRVVVGRVMEGSILAMLNIWKNLIPCAMMFGIVHFKNMHNHMVVYISLFVGLGMEGSRFGKVGVHRME